MKEVPEERITGFIKKHHVLTLATSVDGQAWCSNCFYAYFEDENALIITSDRETRHVKEFLQNSKVAASIVLETRIIGKIQGIQITGQITEPKGEMLIKCRKRYLHRFPYAALMDTTLWMLNIDFIKMTDNNLGFGKKLIWKK